MSSNHIRITFLRFSVSFTILGKPLHLSLNNFTTNEQSNSVAFGVGLSDTSISSCVNRLLEGVSLISTHFSFLGVVALSSIETISEFASSWYISQFTIVSMENAPCGFIVISPDLANLEMIVLYRLSDMPSSLHTVERDTTSCPGFT